MKNRIISLIVLTALVVVSCIPAFALADGQDSSFMHVSFDSADWTFDGDSISAKADRREIYCDTFSPRNAVYNKKIMAATLCSQPALTSSAQETATALY